MSSAYLPTEIWFQILNFATLTPTERRTLRLTNRIFNRFLTPLAFETIRLTSFTKHAFDGILHLAQNTELAAYVKVFEYQVEEFIEAPDLELADRMLGFEIPPKRELEYSEEEEEVADQDWYLQHCDHGIDVSGVLITTDMMARNKKLLRQTDILGTLYDAITLAKALPSFPHLNTVTISFFSSPPFSPLPPLYFHRRFTTAITRAFYTTIKALNLRATPITTLIIDIVPCPRHESLTASQLHHVLSNLTTFSSLCLLSCSYSYRSHDPLTSLNPLLLTSLHLGRGPKSDPRRYLGQLLKFQQLLELRICSVPGRIDEASLAKLIMAMQRLRVLEIVRVGLESRWDGAREHLESVMRGRKLEVVRLEFLMTRNWTGSEAELRAMEKRWEGLLKGHEKGEQRDKKEKLVKEDGAVAQGG